MSSVSTTSVRSSSSPVASKGFFSSRPCVDTRGISPSLQNQQEERFERRLRFMCAVALFFLQAKRRVQQANNE
jgi:hypothetical protein